MLHRCQLFLYSAAALPLQVSTSSQDKLENSSNSDALVADLESCQGGPRRATTFQETPSPPGHSSYRASKVLISVGPSQPWQASVRGDVEEQMKFRLDSPSFVISSMLVIMQAYVLNGEFDAMLLH